ncbi:MAG: hypothetical protein FWG98_02160 [Candidatus Cloacimonetes bacterium]|nr:hypothetical protein [Candidatus Cloacimonadota bacterium]
MKKIIFLILIAMISLAMLHSTNFVVEVAFDRVDSPVPVGGGVPRPWFPPDQYVDVTVYGTGGTVPINVPIGPSPLPNIVPQGYYILHYNHPDLTNIGTIIGLVIEFRSQTKTVFPFVGNHRVDFIVPLTPGQDY